MELSGISNLLKNILEVLDNSGISNSSVLKQSQEPSKELIAEFENILNQEPDNQLQTEQIPAIDKNSDTGDPIQTEIDFSLQKTEKIQPAAAEDTHHIEQTRLKVEPQEYLKEIQQIFTDMRNNALSSSELYRLQYLTGILNVRITQHNSILQSSSNQFETLLKQKG